MAYHITGTEYPVVYCANPRVGSTVTGLTILGMGGYSDGQHHCQPVVIPTKALVVQTVRHHCDVLVSFWYKGGAGVPFEEYVQMVLDGNHPYLNSQAFYKTFKTNYMLRWETLQYEFDSLCVVAGLPQTKLMTKTSKRPKGVSWKNIFNPHLYNKVYNRYREEMEELGYGRN